MSPGCDSFDAAGVACTFDAACQWALRLAGSFLYHDPAAIRHFCPPAAGNLCPQISESTALVKVMAPGLQGTRTGASLLWPRLPAALDEKVRTPDQPDVLQLAGIHFPLSVPTPRGGVTVYWPRLHRAVCRSVGSRLRAGASAYHLSHRPRLDVPRLQGFKTATAIRLRRRRCAKFRRLCVQQRARTDSETRFTSVFWMALHEALWALLIFDSQHHAKHNH